MIGLAALLVGCLPHGAVGRYAELEATRYELTVNAEPPEWLTTQYVRAFADGSAGWLVCLELESACVELRTFPTGEVLTTRGASALSAVAQAKLGAIWPLLSPRIDADPRLVSSWPIVQLGRSRLRVVATGGWQRLGAAWQWSPTLALNHDAPLRADGRLDATVHIDGAGTVDASWALVLPVCGPDGACESWLSAGRLNRRDGVSARKAVPCPQHGEDPSRAPLCLADGTPIEDAPSGVDGESIFRALSAPVKAATVAAEPP
ncbi:hypothetical protein LBMAG42_55200 [Deltaproteobacteria bacterium]|nr:hypothetical protein LBMAG42_55200 [Deltaproteobacteria bacterium]